MSRRELEKNSRAVNRPRLHYQQMDWHMLTYCGLLISGLGIGSDRITRQSELVTCRRCITLIANDVEDALTRHTQS